MTEKIRNILLSCGAGDCGFAAPFIAAVFPYLGDTKPGNISLYARGRDYHREAGERLEKAVEKLRELFPGAAFEYKIDASPWPEVLTAARAGLGVIGENRLLITPGWGSYVFIGLIRTDLDIPSGTEPGSCIRCGACAAACPGVLSGKGTCLSDITQTKGELDPAEEEAVRNAELIWGCDICQLVCPMNMGAGKTTISAFMNDTVRSLSPEDVNCSRREFERRFPERAFTWRGPGPIKRNLEIRTKK